MKFRRVIILACGGMLVVGAACGSDSTESSGTGSSTQDDTGTTVAAPATGDSGSDCSTLAKADVEGIFGAGFADVEDTSTAGTTICGFERESDITSVQYTIKPSSAGEYDATIEASKNSGATATPVSGIGEKATRLVTNKYGITVVQVMAVKGSALFYVTATAQSGSTQAPAEALTKLLADRL